MSSRRTIFFAKSIQRQLSTNVKELPSEADVVIIGGGSIGASTLYHLSQQPNLTPILLEKDLLTAGTTWHSAGLLWRLRPRYDITHLFAFLFNRSTVTSIFG